MGTGAGGGAKNVGGGTEPTCGVGGAEGLRAPDAVAADPRRGNAMIGGPRQSFQVSVTSGATGGLPWNAMSNTARFTSLPAGTRSREVRTRSSCVCSSVSAAASPVPGCTT